MRASRQYPWIEDHKRRADRRTAPSRAKRSRRPHTHAEGTADTRRVMPGKADCLETVEVELAVEYDIASYDEWRNSSTRLRHTRTDSREAHVIDDLLDA